MNNAVLLSGYYGMQNVGDDILMLAGMDISEQFFKQEKLFITAPNTFPCFYKDNVFPIQSFPQKFKGQNRLLKYWNAVKSHNILFAGGSVFHCDVDISQKIHMVKMSGDGPHFAVGVSVGPFKNVRAERLFKELLRHFKFIGVRDRQSYDIVKSLSPDTHCEKTFDLAPKMLAHSKLSADEVSGQGKLGINLCPVFKNGQLNESLCRNVVESLAHVINGMNPDQVSSIELISFNGHGVEGDGVLLSALVKKLKTRARINYVDYLTNPFQVYRAISSCNVMLSMRLHAKIFGYMASVPTLNLCYHNKCSEWSKEIGAYDDAVFQAGEIDSAALENSLLKALDGGMELPELPLEKAISMSDRNWRALNEYC
jgi:polysaccharide pyruvyl transferase WcaK-like protein